MSIDSITTAKPFYCSNCKQDKIGTVNRIIGAIPDFPSQVPVDLLVCGACWAAGKADPDDDSDEQYRDFIRRYPLNAKP